MGEGKANVKIRAIFVDTSARGQKEFEAAVPTYIDAGYKIVSSGVNSDYLWAILQLG